MATENTFKIAFEVLAADRVRVYLNDRAAGQVRLHEVGTKRRAIRLTYRGNSPFKNLIKTASYLDLTRYTVEQLLLQGDVYNQLVAAVIRNYLFQHGGHAELPLQDLGVATETKRLDKAYWEAQSEAYKRAEAPAFAEAA